MENCCNYTPHNQIKKLSTDQGLSMDDERFAKLLDEKDPLKWLRSKFYVPKISELNENDFEYEGINGSKECVYLYGNGLGLQPTNTKKLVDEEMEKWKCKGMLGHFAGERPWFSIEDLVSNQSGVLVGSHNPSLEIAIMNGATANLHIGMVAFYRPTATRHKILIESDAFPTLHYAAESQIRYHRYDPDISLVLMKPRKGEYTLRMEDIIAKIMEDGDSIALVLSGGIHYLTGQYFDIHAITKAAHSKGCYVGLDLAHAIGNVELHLTDWEVDFACWCNYKYLNGGPGSIGGFFLHKKHAHDFTIPRFIGWWSHNRDTRLDMDNNLELQPGAAGFQMSNPPVLETVSLLASLKIFSQTSMKELRKKSMLLTGYLELLLNQCISPAENFSSYHPEGNGKVLKQIVEIITPSDPYQRGCQLSLKFSDMYSVKEINKKLLQQGIICSDRKQNIMRVVPTPMYNTFSDVLTFYKALEKILIN